MGTEYYIDPLLKQIMQLSILMSFSLSIIFLLKKNKSFFYSGFFLVSTDPRYFTYALFGISIVYYFLFIWSIVLLFVYKRKRKNKLYSIFKKLRISSLYFAFIWIFGISLLLRGFSCIISYILIFFSSFVVLYVFAINQDRIDVEKNNGFLFGSQSGFLLNIILMLVFAPGEVTGRLGDISYSADTVGIHAGLSIIISLYFITIYQISIILFMSYAMYSTQSRSPLFATAIVVILAIIISKSNLRYKQIGLIKPVLIVLSISFLFWLVVNFNEIFYKRNVRIEKNFTISVLEQFRTSRIRPMQSVIAATGDKKNINILIGNGIGYWRDISRKGGMIRIETFWYESYYELGIIGSFLLFFGYLKHFLFCLKKYRKNHSRNNIMYILLFLFTFFMSPFSYGWIVYGAPGFFYSFVMGSTFLSRDN